MSQPLPEGTVRPYGNYFVVKAPYHPVSFTNGGKKGWAPRHRKVFYDHVNGEPQKCVYCEYGPLPWRGDWRTAVNIDHFNEVKGDDRIENLLAACSWCNRFKSGWPLTSEEHWRAIYRYGHLAPWDRPEIYPILVEEWGLDFDSIYLNLEINKTEGHPRLNWGIAA